MKKLGILGLFSIIATLIILACTNKEINLVTNVELDFDQNITRSGFVNDLLPATIIITPEAFLPEFEYYFSYEVLEGRGVFLDVDDSELPPNENILLTKEDTETNFTLSLRYQALSAGNQRVRIIASDNFDKKIEVVINYTIENIPILWTATASADEVVLGNSIAATITLQNNTGADITFERSYSFSSGNGQLFNADGTAITQGQTTAITPGVYQIEIAPTELGSNTINFNLEDSNGQLLAATIILNVIPEAINQNPVAVDDTFTASQNTSLTLNVLQNDSDPDGDELTIIEITQPTNGTASITATGILYTPNDSFTGIDTLTYVIDDNQGGTATGTITLTVTTTNNLPPMAVDDSVSTAAGTSVIVEVLTNDSDPEADVLTITATTNPNNGTITINNNGTITYTPNTGFTGNDSFTYTINDGIAENDATANVTIAVTETPNQAPLAADDITNTLQETNVLIDVLANDSDPDGDTLTISAVATPENGTAIISENQIVYTPNSGYTGSEVFDYTISDGTIEDVATITVTVNQNTPPVAINDEAITSQDTETSIPVLTNDSDAENDPITITNVTTPTNGTTSIVDNTILYTPNTGFTGTDIFSYTINDGIAGNDATAEVSVTISLGPNTPPVAVDDVADTFETNPVEILVLSNDSDQENNVLSIIAITQPINGTATIEGNLINYEANSGFIGEDNFTYTINDGITGNDATATVVITVNPLPNEIPIAIDDNATTTENTEVLISVLDNDTDPENDTLTIIDLSAATNGTASIQGNSILYTPSNGYTGNDTFTYTINDGTPGNDTTATVTITVDQIPNQAPIANDDTAITTEGVQVIIPVLENDTDPENDDLTIMNVSDPINGTATISGQNIIYQPNPNFTGNDSFEYTVSDGSFGGEVNATVTITVDAGPNQSPSAVDDSLETTQGVFIDINVLANDSDPEGDIISVSDIDNPLNGTATLNTNGTIRYTPNPNYTGNDAFDYTISDGDLTATARVTIAVNATPNTPPTINDIITTATSGIVPFSVNFAADATDPDNGDTLSYSWNFGDGSPLSAGANTSHQFTTVGSFTVTLTVSDGTANVDDTVIINVAANQPPTATNDTATTTESNAVTIRVLDNDTDPENDNLSITEVSDPLNGNTSIINNEIVYDPNAGFVGNDSFTYTINDGTAGNDASATVLVSVGAAPNQAPIAVNDISEATQGISIIIDVLANDSDPDEDQITISSITDPLNGSATINGDGTIQYTSNVNYLGNDAFNYTITDGNLTATAQVTVSVSPVPNNPPTANITTNVTSGTVPFVVEFSSNATDVDGNNLTYLWEFGDGDTATSANPGHEYDSVGTFTVTLTVSDGIDSVEDTIIINANSNQPFVAVLDVSPISGTAPLEVTMSSLNSSDPDGTIANATFCFDADNNGPCDTGNSRTRTRTYNTPGTYRIELIVRDNNTASDTDSVTITVTAPNTPPIATDDNGGSVQKGNMINIPVLNNDTDGDGDELSVTSIGFLPSANGFASPSGDGKSINYTASINGTGPQTVSFSYTVSDGQGGTDTANVVVEVLPENRPPVANTSGLPVTRAVEEGKSVIFNMTSLGSDPDDDPLIVKSIEPIASGNGTATIGAEQQSIRYTAPNTGAPKTVAFDFVIEDTGGLTSTGTITINVINPIITDPCSGGAISCPPGQQNCGECDKCYEFCP